MAERFLYLPLVGFAVAVVLAADAASKQPGTRFVIYAMLALLVVAYGVRSHHRNADWTDNLTLFTRAAAVCPASFRVHQGLAPALYRANSRQHVDAAIAEAERAQAILERSAPASTPVPGFVLEDLGAYYLAKASFLSTEGGRRGEAATREEVVWNRRAVAALERAAVWERAANDEHRKAERERGKRAEDILDFGNVRLHLNLATAYTKLGESGPALQALLRARQLDPTNADVYMKLSSSYELAGDVEQAILDALQAQIVDRSRQDVWPRLFALYQKTDPGSCAFALVGSQYQFNDACPIVHDHICRAYGQLADIFVSSHQLDTAHQLRGDARRNYGCALTE
jgi:tetratricopeptide (TPR) repeat protein